MADQGFSLPTNGAPNWNVDLNANFQIAERGYLARLVAASLCGSASVAWVNSAGQAVPYDPKSASLGVPRFAAFNVVSPGNAGYFVGVGILSSLAANSGRWNTGEPVYVSASSPGLIVGSFAGHGFPVGIALDPITLLFNPGLEQVFPEKVTDVRTSSVLAVGSYYDFDLLSGNRGINSKVQVVCLSCDNYKLQFWSSSARTAGNLLYETLTTSFRDINTVNFVDAALWPYAGSETNTPYHIYGRVTVQSPCSVTSAQFGITGIFERFR